jgi:hypothetical protein
MSSMQHPETSGSKDGELPKKPQEFAFVAVGDLEYRPPEYIVDELIEAETLGLIFGDPACGKSFLAVDIALSVATGTQFHGKDVRQGSVFFIAGEGHNGLARRFEAWSKDKGAHWLAFHCSSQRGPRSSLIRQA